MSDDTRPVTVIIQAAARGDGDAAEQLLPPLYEELRTLARSMMRRVPPGQTLQPTALVHNAYLRVVGDADAGCNGLRRLEAEDSRKGQLVNLRYFAGLTVEETATVLGVSIETVEHEWRYIKAWLATQLRPRGGDCPGDATS